MKTTDIVMYGDVTMADMIKEAHDVTQDKRIKIMNIIERISPMISNIQDAALLSPIISAFLEVSVKNDDQLIKLIQSVQRLAAALTKMTSSDDGMLLSESEREELLKSLVNDTDINEHLQLIESMGK